MERASLEREFSIAKKSLKDEVKSALTRIYTEDLPSFIKNSNSMALGSATVNEEQRLMYPVLRRLQDNCEKEFQSAFLRAGFPPNRVSIIWMRVQADLTAPVCSNLDPALFKAGLYSSADHNPEPDTASHSSTRHEPNVVADVIGCGSAVVTAVSAATLVMGGPKLVIAGVVLGAVGMAGGWGLPYMAEGQKPGEGIKTILGEDSVNKDVSYSSSESPQKKCDPAVLQSQLQKNQQQLFLWIDRAAEAAVCVGEAE